MDTIEDICSQIKFLFKTDLWQNYSRISQEFVAPNYLVHEVCLPCIERCLPEKQGVWICKHIFLTRYFLILNWISSSSHHDHRHFVPQTRGVWIEYAHTSFWPYIFSFSIEHHAIIIKTHHDNDDLFLPETRKSQFVILTAYFQFHVFWMVGCSTIHFILSSAIL